MRATLIALVIAAGLARATPVVAQPTPRTPSSLDLSAGASWWLEDSLKDFGVTGSVGLHPRGSVIGVVADLGYFATGRRVLLGGQPFKEANRYSLMAGVRFKLEQPRMVPFGQLLIGHAPLDDVAFQPGGGIDWLVSRRLALRVGGDVKFSGDGGLYTGFRVSTGLVLRR